MGLDYTIYCPNKQLGLASEVDLIHQTFIKSIKTKHSEYYIDFSVSNIEQFPQILHRFGLTKNDFYLSSDEFSCGILDCIPIIENIELYDSCYIHSSKSYDKDSLGFSLTIDSKNLKLSFEIGLPYEELETSKSELCKLLMHLYSEGIYLGFSDYDNIDQFINKLVDLNSSTKPSFTWQLNIGDYSFKHSNSYAHNSKFGNEKDNTYRMTGIKVDLPQHYFGHKNLADKNKIDQYSTRLLVALSKYFIDDKIRIQFTSSNNKLIQKIEPLNGKNFKLSSKINLSKVDNSLHARDINQLLESKDDEYTLCNVKLNENHAFDIKLSLIRSENEELKFLLYVDYDYEKEDSYKELIENDFGFKLKYIGAE